MLCRVIHIRPATVFLNDIFPIVASAYSDSTPVNYFAGQPMAFCSSCGTDLPIAVRFCSTCGKPVGSDDIATLEFATAAITREPRTANSTPSRPPSSSGFSLNEGRFFQDGCSPDATASSRSWEKAAWAKSTAPTTSRSASRWR